MNRSWNRREWWRRIRNSRITHNIAALFGSQAAIYIFPLATLPYLARVLGPVHWGVVAFAQALALYLAMIIDFGFQLSATRRVANAREDKEEMAGILAGVMGAKLLLTFACIAVAVVLQYTMPLFREYSFILWAGVFSGIAQGLGLLWYYQGMEQMKISSLIDILGRAVATAGIFLFVHHPEDAWKVLALQCVAFSGSAAILLILMYREVPWRWPTLSATRMAMRDSAAMFLFRSSVSLYTTANALLLGALATPVAVAFYSGAERLTKALLNLLTPVSQSLYPRLCRLIITDRPRAIWLARVAFVVMTLGSVIAAAGAFWGAPLIVRVILGRGYEAAVPVMRILSLLLPPVAISTVLGIQWMLPLRMDAIYNKIIISAGGLNLLLAILWASRWQQIGMAWAVVTSEYMVTLAVCIVLARKQLSPLSNQTVLQLKLQEQLAEAGA